MSYIKTLFFFITGLVTLSFLRQWLKPKTVIIQQIDPSKFEELSPEDKVKKFEELR